MNFKSKSNPVLLLILLFVLSIVFTDCAVHKKHKKIKSVPCPCFKTKKHTFR